MTRNCFLLTSSWRDRANGFEMQLYAVTESGIPLEITVDTFRPLFFIPRSCPAELTVAAHERKPLPLSAMRGVPVDCLYFRTNGACRDTARLLHEKGMPTFESDINPVDRFLMERGVKGGFVCEGDIRSRPQGDFVRNPHIRGAECTPPAFKVLSLDIETSVEHGTIYSIAGHGTGSDFVLIAKNGNDQESIRFCGTEQAMLKQFLDEARLRDPDIIIGWSVIDFDLRMLQARCTAWSLPFALGRGGAIGRLVPVTQGGSQHLAARIPGRVVIDVPIMLRTYYSAFEEYSLDFVASRMLGRGKLIEQERDEKIAEINRRFAQDPVALAQYNLEDAVLTKEIFDKAGVLPNAVERTRRSGLQIDRARGSVAAFDFLYLPLLHRAGYVAGNTNDVVAGQSALTGGYVMEPVPGIYENVLLLDFKSLYPTIIMTFCIDPLGLVHPSTERIQGPSGRSFAKTPSLLPGIIDQLMSARAQAKQEGNPYLSQAIKILMNSFYGVLGTTGCRFFSTDLAQAITETGQFLFRKTCDHIESTFGYKVIYGDTDSLFVHLGADGAESAAGMAERIVASVNEWLVIFLDKEYGAQSRLELEFETHFRHLLIPSVRGGGVGSKKHYCGATENNGTLALHFKGMESARSDWTDLAKEFQHELCLRLFTTQPVEEYIREIVQKVRSGECDQKLVYRKKLRKELNEYAGTPPPHVQAAMLLPSPPSTIYYCITVQGPQPLSALTAPLDYEHYLECQLKPIADTLLEWSGTDFERIVSGQMDLFG